MKTLEELAAECKGSYAAGYGLSPEYMARCFERSEPPNEETVEVVRRAGLRFSVEVWTPDGGLSFRMQVQIETRNAYGWWYRSPRARIDPTQGTPGTESERLEQEVVKDLREIGTAWRIETYDGWPIPWPGQEMMAIPSIDHRIEGLATMMDNRIGAMESGLVGDPEPVNLLTRFVHVLQSMGASLGHPRQMREQITDACLLLLFLGDAQQIFSDSAQFAQSQSAASRFTGVR